MRISDWSSDVCSSDLADARGIGHAGYGKARAEQRAGEQGDDPAHHHDTPSARIAGTVTNPASMNAPVAAIERGDRRERPQKPWPLVQPLPNLVPKPTISPPINRIPSDGANGVSTGPPTPARIGKAHDR